MFKFYQKFTGLIILNALYHRIVFKYLNRYVMLVNVHTLLILYTGVSPYPETASIELLAIGEQIKNDTPYIYQNRHELVDLYDVSVYYLSNEIYSMSKIVGLHLCR